MPVPRELDPVDAGVLQDPNGVLLLGQLPDPRPEPNRDRLRDAQGELYEARGHRAVQGDGRRGGSSAHEMIRTFYRVFRAVALADCPNE